MLKLLYSIPFLRSLYFNRIGLWWIRRKVAPFINHLSVTDKIIDVGSGNGLVADFLRQQGFDVTPLDIVSMPYHERVAPIVYDGKTMPFEEKSFDVALILTVLHHIERPEPVLEEAQRIAHKIIIIEDIYKNKLQKYATFFMDWLVNLGYSPAPHTNKNDKGWRMTFDNMELKVLHTVQWRVLLLFRQVVYILQSLNKD